MKKITLKTCVLSLCLGLLIAIGGLCESPIAWCQPEEEEEPIQARPRPDMYRNTRTQQRELRSQGQMKLNTLKDRQGTVADDGQHGDGIQPAMQPGRAGSPLPAGRVQPEMPRH